MTAKSIGKRSTLGAIGLAALLIAGCSGSSNDKQEPTTTTTALSTTTTSDPTGPPPALKIMPIATVDKPTAMATRSNDATLYVAEKPGRVREINGTIVNPDPVLDISSEVSTGGEQGLLGIAFAPDKPLLYIDYTDRAGDTHIVEYTMNALGKADVGTRRELLTIDQPYPNHNGGQLAFGPDGYLYIGMGDGGSAGDPQKNAQNLTVLLGKILRINPTPTATLPYTIPFDNPLVKQSGARGEIWAYGLRNPWRFSFDRENQSLWIADVGQGKWEEIDRVDKDPKGGENYGWPLREGTHKQDGEKPKDAIDPIYEYDHSNGACSVTGGYVYRGDTIAELTGRYVFGDYCNGQISSLTKRGTVWAADSLQLKVANLSSFGQDNTGELYTLSLDGQIGRIDAAQ